MRIALILAKNILQNQFRRCFCLVSTLCSLAVANTQFSLGCRLPSLRSTSALCLQLVPSRYSALALRRAFALLVDSDNWLHLLFFAKKKVKQKKRDIAPSRWSGLIDFISLNIRHILPEFLFCRALLFCFTEQSCFAGARLAAFAVHGGSSLLARVFPFPDFGK